MIGKACTYRSRCLRIGLAGVAVVLALAASSTSFAAPKYWVATGGAKNWSTPTNWYPSGVPGITDDVVLSNTMSNNDVLIDLDVDIASLTVQNGYAKDIGPTGSQTIRIRGDVTYAGAAGFSLTASVAQVDGNLTVNSGELRTGAGTTLIGGNVTLADRAHRQLGPHHHQRHHDHIGVERPLRRGQRHARRWRDGAVGRAVHRRQQRHRDRHRHR